MIHYIIKRIDSWGGYVAPQGSKSSYCVNPAHARKFATRELAEADMCVDNEIVLEREY